MSSFFKSTEFKAILVSVLIHSSLLGAYIYSQKEQPQTISSEKKTISIDLSTFTPPQKVIKKVEPKKAVKKAKPKKIKPKKVVKKAEPKKIKPKKVIKKTIEKKVIPKKIVKEEVVEKEIVENIETKDTQEKKVVQQKPVKKTTQQKFTKTDFAIIRDMVISNLKYPRVAKKMRHTGTVKVKLTIDKFGNLTSYTIAKSSGRKHLDKAALKAVESIKNSALPKPKIGTTIILPIVFKLQ